MKHVKESLTEEDIWSDSSQEIREDSSENDQITKQSQKNSSHKYLNQLKYQLKLNFEQRITQSTLHLSRTKTAPDQLLINNSEYIIPKKLTVENKTN